MPTTASSRTQSAANSGQTGPDLTGTGSIVTPPGLISRACGYGDALPPPNAISANSRLDLELAEFHGLSPELRRIIEGLARVQEEKDALGPKLN